MIGYMLLISTKWDKEASVWVSFCEEIGVLSQGKSEMEAIDNCKGAIRLWLSRCCTTLINRSYSSLDSMEQRAFPNGCDGPVADYILAMKAAIASQDVVISELKEKASNGR